MAFFAAQRRREEAARNSSLHIAFQNDQQLAQLLLCILRAGRVLDAIVRVRMNELFAQRLDSLSRGNELSENFGTIPVLFDHSIDRGQLAGDLAQPQPQCFSLLFWMLVVVWLHKNLDERRKQSIKEGYCPVKGYGGMVLIE